jgi:uncharacterized protein (DUF362 family)
MHSVSDSRSHRLSRRRFLGALSIPFVAAGCGRRPPYNPTHFSRPAISAVGLFPAADYAADFADIIARGLRELGIDVRGRRVFLKPNIVEYEANTAINTHPLVVAGAAVAFRSAGAREVVVGEGPGHRRDIEYLITRTGLYEQLREHRVRFVDLNHDDVREVALGSHFTGMATMMLPVELLQSDFIVSMPKLKTHHWAAMTAGMKNFFGSVPSAVYGWPKNLLHVKGIENSILDLNATIRPHFSIVDAVTAMEGDGPIMGRPRTVGFIAMGPDVVSVDATCARIIGLDPGKMPHLREAGRFLGNIDLKRIQHRGEPPSKYETTFDIVEHFKIIRLRPGGAQSAAAAPLIEERAAPAGY